MAGAFTLRCLLPVLSLLLGRSSADTPTPYVDWSGPVTGNGACQRYTGGSSPLSSELGYMTMYFEFQSYDNSGSYITLAAIGDSDQYTLRVQLYEDGSLQIKWYLKTEMGGTGTGDYRDGSWHSFAAVWDSSSTTKYYVDGSLVASSSLSHAESHDVALTHMYIGCRAKEGSQGEYMPSTTSVRNLQVFDQALTELEIQALPYSGGEVVDDNTTTTEYSGTSSDCFADSDSMSFKASPRGCMADASSVQGSVDNDLDCARQCRDNVQCVGYSFTDVCTHFSGLYSASSPQPNCCQKEDIFCSSYVAECDESGLNPDDTNLIDCLEMTYTKSYTKTQGWEVCTEVGAEIGVLAGSASVAVSVCGSQEVSNTEEISTTTKLQVYAGNTAYGCAKAAVVYVNQTWLDNSDEPLIYIRYVGHSSRQNVRSCDEGWYPLCPQTFSQLADALTALPDVGRGYFSGPGGAIGIIILVASCLAFH